MPITAGSLRITRRKAMEPYSHREATVELHYVVEGDEKIGDLGDMARVEALTQVAMANATDVKIEPPVLIELGAERIQGLQNIEPKPAVGADLIQAMENAVVAEKKRQRRTKAQMEAARAETAMPLTPLEQVIEQKAAEEANFTPHYEITDQVAIVTPEISDKALDVACGETMHRIKNKPAIQAVIQQYTDGKVSTIPQAQRTEFLKKLKAL